MRVIPRVLTIAGSDSGAGAGIQADLKTFAAFGVYGTSVITAITAQNTQVVDSVFEVPVQMIDAQIDSVLGDIGTDSVKVGMLSSVSIIEAVTDKIVEHDLAKLVVDPVMVAKGGSRLLEESAVDALRTLLMPLATVVTPNIPEAEVISGSKISTLDDMKNVAIVIVEMGARSVVIKGGHMEGPATDVFYDGTNLNTFTSPRLTTTSVHGTGCTFGSAIAAGLAKNRPMEIAVREAKEYVLSAIRHAFPIGQGHGPLNHFHKVWL